MFSRLFLAAVVVMGVAQAGVVKLVVEKREAFAGAANPTQAYEKLTGRFFGELDPAHPLNAIITDIEFAPRNARGMVEYSATFTILKPGDMSKASGVLAYQVTNRGTANIEGGGFYADFRRAGHVLVASGWQADIAARPGIETMIAPIAKNADGSSITGPVMSRIYDAPAGATTQPIIRGRVSGTATPASYDTTKATLTRRIAEDAQRIPIKAADWAFADCAAAVHFPLVSLATKAAYGRDFLEEIPQVKPYLKMLGERPSVAKVNADRRAAVEASKATAKS